jgi:hypothetical protein
MNLFGENSEKWEIGIVVTVYRQALEAGIS